MGICFIFLTIGLLKNVSARSIPEYDLCMEACGEDPHEDDFAETIKVDACRDKCNYEERNRCLEKHKHSVVQKRECWKSALDRCIVRCGDYPICIQMCRYSHTPPMQ
ncbi:hypothetical protein CRM22_011324 [Opisthorchis felineus]|uniref:Uncharacterized protein n=1 Tax=Opisthorchis felineus TaxID=147828 RepID=A0A4S2JTL8_OPIFE|nr:hypothetical protein CRM22_011324 [Opisthorchis felineus]